MGKPAARIGDLTAHGGTVVGPGCPTVLIGKMPAAVMGDMHVCPMVTPGVPPIPHVGGPLVGPVPPTVFFGKKPAACVGDMAICVGPPSTILPPGCPTVLLGCAPPSGGGGGGGALSIDPLQAIAKDGTKLSDIENFSSIPVDMQETLAEAALKVDSDHIKKMTFDIAVKYKKHNELTDENKKATAKLTIKDIAEILEAIEEEDGFESARFFASYLNYRKLTELAKTAEEIPDNNSNQIPTRFILLYGADDSLLSTIDEHPDNFEDAEEHPINVANLRKGLKLLGYDIAEEGIFDNEVYVAYMPYLASTMNRAPYPFEELEEEKDEDK